MNKIENLKQLKEEPKFEINDFYNGLADKTTENVLSQLLDEIIDEFISGTESNYSDEEYQILIKKSLKKFDPYNLDTEDREYICEYFEKIMDAVELESSGGALMEWMYGFDFGAEPTPKD